MKLAILGWLLAMTLSVSAQPVRLRIRHADPWMVKAMLEGQQVTAPEISTVWALNGMMPAAGQAVQNYFARGRFVVNAADNSLWFFPERQAG